MPKKHVRDGSQLKRTVKRDAKTRNVYRYSDGADVERHLQTQGQDGLTDALIALRNQLTVKYGEELVQPQDERLALARSWLEITPRAQSIFSIWENTTERQPSLLALLISVLSSLLTILSTHYTHHKLGQPILTTLLSSDYLFYLNSYFNCSHNELIIATLKLFRAMSEFGGGGERKAILEGFSWENKGLHKLLSMRRRTKMTGSPDVLVIPDIRTLYILFILSFVDDSAASLVKSSFLEQRHDIFRAIFGGLDQDPYSLARKILEVAWTGIWLDPKIKRTVKVNIFNEATLHHIMKLYNRSVAEASDDQIPADLAHHFLLAICTHPGVGVCFKDRGWYPRETGEDVGLPLGGNDETAPKSARIYNKILANSLKTLKVNEDPRQQELALRVMSACPELVCGYWSSASLTLEPRLSSKWIANIAFFGNVVSLPVPEVSFLLPGKSLYLPTPPPLAAFLENIFPSVNTKAHFSRGILSAFPLVQHCTALALAKSLTKYSEVLKVMRKVESELEENESDGQWKKRRNELELEARRRVPDFQVVIAFSQKTGEDVQSAPEDLGSTIKPPSKVQVAMLAESSTRLLWLYHLCFPSLVAEARFDPGKLLQNSFDNDINSDSIAMPNSGFKTLRRLHVLRLLRESNQFLWSSKSSSRSYISVLLSAYISIDVITIRDAIRSLVRHVLSRSILFEHDPDEIYFWISSLPIGFRALDAEAPDDTSLLNEQAAVVNFLDDCIQLCLREPYGYIEESHTLNSDSTTANIQYFGGNAFSPLVMTVMEQIASRIATRLCSSDMLAIVSFVRRLLVRLSGKRDSLGALVHLSEKLASLPIGKILVENHGTMSKAIAQEITIMENHFQLLVNPFAPIPIPEELLSTKSDFLDRIENIPLPRSNAQRWNSAFELIDFVRLVGSPVPGEMAIRLLNIMSRNHHPAIRILLSYLNPSQRLLRNPSFFTSLRKAKSIVPFDWAFIQCGPEQLSEVEYRSLLTDAIFDGPKDFFEAKFALEVIGHRMSSRQAQSSTGSGVLLLIADIMQAGRRILHSGSFMGLREHLFGMPQINALFTSSMIGSEVIEQGIRPILDAVVDPANAADRSLLLPFSSHWAQLSLTASRFSIIAQITLWIPYMTHEEVLSILDNALLDFYAIGKEEGILDVLHAVLFVVERHANAIAGDIPGLRSRLAQLVSLYSVQPTWALLESLITRAVDSAFIAWIDGLPPACAITSSALDSLVLMSCSRWSKRSQFRSEGLDISVFLQRPEWTTHTVSVIRSLTYHSHLAPVIWSWLDASDNTSIIRSPGEWRNHFDKLTANIIDTQASQSHRLACRRAILVILQKLSSLRLDLFSNLQACVKAMSADTLTTEVLRLGKCLTETLPRESEAFASSLLEHALDWVSRSFASPDNLDNGILNALASFAKGFPSIKPHLTDAVLTVLIQNRLSDVTALDLGVILVDGTHLKPLLINRHLQSIVQHADFYKHTEINTASRDAVIHLVHVLFLKNPTNTCQPSHVLPLSPSYGFTLSTADRRLLGIFALFEETRKVSVASLFTRSISGPHNALDVLLSLDPASVFRACLQFPAWRKLDDLGYQIDSAHPLDRRIYDPVFVTLLVAHVLATQRPSSTAQWVQLFRTNVVSLLIRSLSSRNDLLRGTCVTQIGAVMDALQSADMQEKPHVFYILRMLKDAIKEPLEEGPSPRLPSFSTLLLAHALRGVFYPEHFIYPLTARFLLQRPELDTTDVPMLYAMLYSSSDDWRRERSWILKFIADAMLSAGDEEWNVFRRRHTWDLLAGLFQSGRQDRTLRHEVLEILLNLTNSRRITTSLVLKSGLLSWIEMSLLDPRQDEGLLWMRVLENILDIVDPQKLESATGGEWRRAIGRCMSLLRADAAASTSHTAMLLYKSRIVMRLGLLPGPPVPTFDALLSQCLVSLRHLEKGLILSTFPVALRSSPHSRHTSYSIREGNATDSHELWGEVVVYLWRAAMASESSGKAWDELTPRILVWNLLVDGEDHVAEWARREVVWNTTTQTV
ncbi:ribosome 60S biogenesis N-terminal-domain-containing protein [Russula earlei]|uniref:Ribosome 60S biogenesis N-terminal-domain-containing protein n=1 Tax=Russula earlei TaxID=71964 RepID=A0ACC0UMN3_9AGAM|nr:ribosome 60S biogenesis N-terminal-domain-containing protein [Russula earlei]